MVVIEQQSLTAVLHCHRGNFPVEILGSEHNVSFDSLALLADIQGTSGSVKPKQKVAVADAKEILCLFHCWSRAGPGNWIIGPLCFLAKWCNRLLKQALISCCLVLLE